MNLGYNVNKKDKFRSKSKIMQDALRLKCKKKDKVRLKCKKESIVSEKKDLNKKLNIHKKV